MLEHPFEQSASLMYLGGSRFTRRGGGLAAGRTSLEEPAPDSFGLSPSKAAPLLLLLISEGLFLAIGERVLFRSVAEETSEL